HHDVYERNNGELHKRLSLNSLVILDHPADRGSMGPARAGAVIYWEAPRTIQTLRKLGDPNTWPGPPMHREWGEIHEYSRGLNPNLLDLLERQVEIIGA
ncbi:hypothetical protein TRAPUB_2410, partial [Trametes pubescens]